MNFTQRTRGIVKTLAVVLSLALPVMLAISAADARRRRRRQLGLARGQTFSAPPSTVDRAECGAADQSHHDPAG